MGASQEIEKSGSILINAPVTVEEQAARDALAIAGTPAGKGLHTPGARCYGQYDGAIYGLDQKEDTRHSWDVNDIAGRRYTTDDLLSTASSQATRTPAPFETPPANPQLRKTFLGETDSSL